MAAYNYVIFLHSVRSNSRPRDTVINAGVQFVIKM